MAVAQVFELRRYPSSLNYLSKPRQSFQFLNGNPDGAASR
jgi:hypothetical protein